MKALTVNGSAWAIRGERVNMVDPETTFLCGVFFWSHSVEAHRDGMRTGLFRTRAKARKAAKKLNSDCRPFMTFHVVKVATTIQEIGR